MVFSYYLYKYPYKLLWYLNSYIGKTIEFAFYCADPLDYKMFLPIAKFLPGVQIIAKNSKTKKFLSQSGIPYTNMPAFPKVVIMARQTPYKFPVDKIVKFGFDHGLYQFKRWTSPENYNGFNLYFVSSPKQVEIANSMGINSVRAVGYPKLDNAFNGHYNEAYIENLKRSLQLNPQKKTIIFTSTWNVAGLSVLSKWIDKLDLLTNDYNILVTVHTWTAPSYISKLKFMKQIHFIEEYDVTPYLMIADVLVGDYSSIIGEFCAFDKPIITFEVPESERTIPEILQLIKSISIQINDFDEIHEALERCIRNPNEKQKERQEANNTLFYKLDGLAGKRAAEFILSAIKKNN